MVLGSHEAGPNGWFAIALLVPTVVGIVLGLGLSLIRKRTLRLQPVLVAMAVAATGLTLHVSVVTWRDHKDVAMCRSWDRPERLERCISERRERARGPWGIFVRANGD